MAKSHCGSHCDVRARMIEALDIAQIGYWNWDIANKKLIWSDQIFRLFGLDPEEVQPTVSLFFKHVWPKDRPFLKKCIQQAIKGEPYSVEHRFITANGDMRWMYDRGEVVLDNSGRPIRMFGVAQDITQRNNTEDALRLSEERYRQLVEISPAAIFVENEGKIVMANSATAELLGVESAAELKGRLTEEFLSDSYRPLFRQKIQQVIENKPPYTREKLIRKDDKTIDVEMSASVFHCHGMPSTRITAWDITLNKQREEEYIKATKLESLGVLAGGIAHDFNNILTITLGYLSVARNCSNINDIHLKLNEAQIATKQAVGLTKQLLTFSKGGVPVKNTASIKELIEENVNFVLHGSNIKCGFKLAENLHSVEVDRDQISQVINNLIINAIQAMPKGGTITICAKNAIVDRTCAVPLQDGTYVEIAIQDTGGGIPEEIIQNIFDPYFTTKSSGTGLGLTTSYSIIKQHDGCITVDSQHGSGTTFTIYLPASHQKTNINCDKQGIRTGKGRVLVMDDEQSIRKLAGDMLHILDYEAEFASDGYEALALYSKAMARNERFDAVILDLTIRGSMGGKETVQKLLNLDPDVLAIVSSGYSQDPVIANYKSYGFKGVVAKPYQLEDLADVLYKVAIEQKFDVTTAG